MLSPIEIDQYYLELSEHFINKDDIVMNIGALRPQYCLKTNDFRIIATSFYLMSCKSLSNFTFSHIKFFFGPETNNIQIQRSKIWLLKFDTNQIGLPINVSKNLNIESKEELYDLILNNQKCFLLDDIYRKVDYLRQNNTSGLFYQDLIYKTKYDEAKEILKNNITEDMLMYYPYTSGYAEIMDITLQESAKLIVLQYESENGFLLETENMRIRYTNIIRKENDISKLNSIKKAFLKENDILGII